MFLLRHRDSAVRHAFTLIELLVVVSIIGLLVGILLPVLASARATARASICLSNVRLIGVAAHMYAQQSPGEVWVGYPGPGSDRKVLLYPYTNSGVSNSDRHIRQLWHCPEAKTQLNVTTGIEDVEASYGFNTHLNFVPLRRIMRPAETVALCDAGLNDDLLPRTATHAMPPSTLSNSTLCRPNPRHSKSVNVAFADGHASATKMIPPFYPNEAGVWLGNGITDPNNPNYKDELWDLR